jgi:small-conductance mechanosensitive channel
MAEDEIIGAVSGQVEEFSTVGELLASSESLQIALTILIVGFVGIFVAHKSFSKWARSQKFSYARPHFSKFVRVVILPFFAIALITSINLYIDIFEIFDKVPITDLEAIDVLTPIQTFAKILDSINIIVIGYTIGRLIPIILNKKEKVDLEQDDFDVWQDMGGFKDDDDDFFHKLYKWQPPSHTPEDMDDEEFQKNLKTEEGRKFLESFRTSKGTSIGSYHELVDDPFEEWKKSERAKYEKYYQDCITGNNEAGKKLKPGQKVEQIYPIDTWREQKRLREYEPVIPGYRPPGFAKRQKQGMPVSINKIIPLGVFAATILGVLTWWGIDLIVLATATGGLAIGIGFALQETMQNWFAYIMIRKDKIVVEGDRIQLESGYNGYVHKITSRVTYVRHGLNESYAIIPTRQLVNAQIINYSKDLKMVPAQVDVGVSYLNNPKGVAAVLVKVGKRVMKECVDDKGKHLVRQKRCPYLEENKPSCGCDKGILVDINQPIVRFNQFNDSSLDFSIWVYVKDYGAQFKTKTDMRMIMYEEFKKYDIRIPWPIRTVYQGDEKREAEEIGRLREERKKVIEEYGIGDIGKGGDED